MDNTKHCYRRVLLKLSGESFQEKQPSCFSMKAVSLLGRTVSDLTEQGVQMAVVIGGGNIWRGRDAEEYGLPQVSADHIGMTATILNALVFQAVLEKNGTRVHILAPNKMQPLIESHHWKKATNYLEEGRVVIFAGGTGCPLFSTDTAAALRAVEINAEIILKATTVPYVYNDDPNKNHHAVSYDHVTYDEIIQKQLGIIDGSAAIICKMHRMPMRIFSMQDNPLNLKKIIHLGESIGTLVTV